MGSKPNWARGASGLGDALLKYGFAKDRQKFLEDERRKREAAQMAYLEASNEKALERQKSWLDYSDPIYEGPQGTFLPMPGMPEAQNKYHGMRTSDANAQMNRDREFAFQQDEAAKDEAYRQKMLGFASNRDARAGQPAPAPPPKPLTQSEIKSIKDQQLGRATEKSYIPGSVINAELWKLYGEDFANEVERLYDIQIGMGADPRNPLVSEVALRQTLAGGGFLPNFGPEVYQNKGGEGGRFFDPTYFREQNLGDDSLWDPRVWLGKDKHAMVGEGLAKTPYETIPGADYFAKVVQPAIDKGYVGPVQIEQWAKEMKIPPEVLMKLLVMPGDERDKNFLNPFSGVDMSAIGGPGVAQPGSSGEFDGLDF